MAQETQEVVKVVEKKVDSAAKTVSQIKIKSDADLQKAATVMTNVKTLQKFVKQEKEKITKPLNDALKAARNLFIPIERQIDDAADTLSSEMAKYHAAQEKERAEKEAKIAKQMESGRIKEETALRKMGELGEEKKSVATHGGTVSFKKVKKVRFAALKELSPVDQIALAEAGYLIWDEVAARRDALGGKEIPGVEVYEETITSTAV